MIQFKNQEIDITKCNFSECTAIIPFENGTIMCIPEHDCTDEERKLIEAIKADVEGRSQVEEPVAVAEPIVEDYLLDYEFRISMLELGGI